MSRLIAIRILQAVPVIVIVSVLAFLLINLLPGDPAVVIAGDQASPEAIAVVRHNLGLDIPTKGVRTTFGSIAFADHVPDRDDVLVTRLSTQPEFASTRRRRCRGRSDRCRRRARPPRRRSSRPACGRDSMGCASRRRSARRSGPCGSVDADDRRLRRDAVGHGGRGSGGSVDAPRRAARQSLAGAVVAEFGRSAHRLPLARRRDEKSRRKSRGASKPRSTC